MSKIKTKIIGISWLLIFGICFLPLGVMGQKVSSQSHLNFNQPNNTVAMNKWLKNVVALQNSNPKITLKLTNTSLAKALKAIAKEAAVSIYYNSKLLPDKQITLQVKDMPLGKVLQKVLGGTFLKAVSSGRSITLLKMEQKQINFSAKNVLSGLSTKSIKESISGTVRDASTGQPLIGVSILVIGTSTGTTTNVDGHFTLSVGSLQDSLRFTYIGYQTKTVPINGRTNIDVSLKSTSTELAQLVVTGYGVERKSQLTGSIATIDTTSIRNVPAQNPLSLIQGRAPGVLVTSNSGNPGSGLTIQVRGNGSINAGTQPLYIVDGIEINTANGSSLSFASPLNNIDPDNIKSIQILKDAASAAIYGAQGANGVVIITTKTGYQGPTMITVKAEGGIRKNINRFNLANSQEWLRYYQQAYGLTDQETVDLGNSFGYAFDDHPFSSIDAFPTHDWQDDVYKTGSHQGYSLRASGGTTKTQYTIFGSYNKTAGTIKGSNFDRYQLALSLNNQFTQKLSGKVHLNLSNTNQFGLCQGANSIGCPVSNSLFQPPVAPAFLSNGDYNPKTLFGATSNQALLLDKETRNVSNVSILGNMSATYDFTSWLSLKGFFGLDWRMGKDKRFTPPVLSITDHGNIYKRIRNTFNFNTSAQLIFNHTFNDVHNLNGFVAVEYRRDYNDRTGATTTHLNNEIIKVLNGGAVPVSAYGFNTEFRVASYFTNVRYNYNQLYFINVTARYDGSSRFGENNRWGFFPSGSVGWQISNESFFHVGFINSLKLTASYGITGNAEIDNFQTLGTYQIGGSYLGHNSLSPSRLANPDLTWEELHGLNIGLSFGMVNNRVSGSVSVYRRNTKNLLLNRPLIQTSGFSSILQNVGAVQNEGFEFNINTINIRQAGFQWSTRFNISIQKNTVTKLNQGQDQLGSGSTPTAVGHSINAWWIPKWAGVNPADGRPMWYDQNGHMTYQPTNDDNVFVDGLDQDAYGGFGTTFNYKSLSLDVFFQGSYGKSAPASSLVVFLRTPTFHGAVDRSIIRSWNHPGQVTDLPRPSPGDAPDGSANWRGLSGTGFLSNEGYIRLKSVTLSYSLPTTLTNKLNLSNLMLYISGFNLYTWTKWPGLDPEHSRRAAYPSAMQLDGGIQIKF